MTVPSPLLSPSLARLLVCVFPRRHDQLVYYSFVTALFRTSVIGVLRAYGHLADQCEESGDYRRVMSQIMHDYLFRCPNLRAAQLLQVCPEPDTWRDKRERDRVRYIYRERAREMETEKEKRWHGRRLAAVQRQGDRNRNGDKRRREGSMTGGLLWFQREGWKESGCGVGRSFLCPRGSRSRCRRLRCRAYVLGAPCGCNRRKQNT